MRWGILASLVVFEVLLVGFLQFAEPTASHAFLIKDGSSYAVYWSAEGQYDFATYKDLRSALKFAHNSLGLSEGSSFQGMDIERLWTQDRFGSFVVMWKTFRHPHLNQLTFSREADARFFETAFRTGSYTPSPFGHSILLLPVAR